jgi:hypothetical protein
LKVLLLLLLLLAHVNSMEKPMMMQDTPTQGLNRSPANRNTCNGMGRSDAGQLCPSSRCDLQST